MYDIYSNAKNDDWRFSLGKSGSRRLLTIGLNPSTATKEKSDTTVAKVEQVAIQNGFDGFVMLNLYPIRATDFKVLPRDVDQDAFTQNLDHIESLISAEPAPVIWAAWGESILVRTFFVDSCIKLFSRLRNHPVSWQRFGKLTASGHPRHPSRLSYAWEFAPLDVKNYLHNLRT